MTDAPVFFARAVTNADAAANPGRLLVEKIEGQPSRHYLSVCDDDGNWTKDLWREGPPG